MPDAVSPGLPKSNARDEGAVAYLLKGYLSVCLDLP